ncbi:MAG: serine hydroxymethyltransferase [Planctomycetes bacterium]|nr:serine hydroxymethyltransferase [Planctomycetota bacterium]
MFAYDDKGSKASRIDEVVRAEAQRQIDELILIPSESICFPEVAQTLAGDFGNIYAEGQARLRLARDSESLAHDAGYFRAWHRRLSDGRFYRGCQQADRVELLAKDAIAKAFALLPGSPPANAIHANVQALSGAPANLAVFTALLQPGDAVMGLDLTHGGHLSHGSPFNVTGKQYNVCSYGIDEDARGDARRLDYDRIREAAKQHRPKLLIGGASAYPWDWDWAALRSIADEVGAYLLADVAHLAGMIVGGVLANPLPHAHVVTFTTHKTLCGPRGAGIVSACRETARKLDNAVFPGLQGGPHMNAIAGIGRLFEIILERRESFVALQKRIVANAKVLADALKGEGFALEYGGTNTHLMLVDLKQLKCASTGGNGTLDGEIASRLLEDAGIVCNKNTLPGDRNAAYSTGLRFGTPWITQRGITEGQLKALAKTIRGVLTSSRACKVYVPNGTQQCRGRMPFAALRSARAEVRAIASKLPYPKRPEEGVFGPTTVLPTPVGDRLGLCVRGEKARLGLDQLLTCNVLNLKPGQAAHGFLLQPDGAVLDHVAVVYRGRVEKAALGPNGEERFAVFPHKAQYEIVRDWIEAVSDGYVLIDAEDPWKKIDGPLAIASLEQKELTAELRGVVQKLPSLKGLDGAPAEALDAGKPFFVGQAAISGKLKGAAKPAYAEPKPAEELRKTLLNETHKALGAKMVPFGGWEMPVQYPAGIFKEHAAVRGAAGLFDVSHMSALDVRGPNALPFLEAVLANTATRLVPGEAQYSYILTPDGIALDDLYVYRLGVEHFMIVVNAGNADRDIAWFKAVNAGEVLIDPAHPHRRVPGPVEFRDLRNAGQDSKLDLAFQGPLSATILAELAKNDAQKNAILASSLNDILHVELKGIPVTAARTGYTGELMGFELFVHPDRVVELWNLLLDTGKDRGVIACGLGARDSLRTEAGFPLFGHELEGSEALSLTEAGYGFVSRFHKPFYVGRDAYIRRLSPRKKKILRLKGSGRRSVRGGSAILDSNGKPVGVVTSFAFADPDFNFYVLAAVENNFRAERGSTIKAARLTPDQVSGPVEADKLVELEVCSRFASQAEKAAWQAYYGK